LTLIANDHTLDFMRNSLAVAFLMTIAFTSLVASAEYIWIEGEKPVQSTMHRHPWWYDKVKKDRLSGGGMISNFADTPGEATYTFTAKSTGDYEFWVHANLLQSRLSYKLNDAADWTRIDLEHDLVDNENIAEDGKPDLRFIAWAKAGTVKLSAGKNTIAFRMDSENHNCGMLDCFVLSTEPFKPRGILKPEEIAAADQRDATRNVGWVTFDPPDDPFKGDSAIDLRYLNEKQAGDGGFIAVKGAQFIHSRTSEPIRFWAVNGCPGETPEQLQHSARVLAKHGVNLVRAHGGYFDADGNVDPQKVLHAMDVVAACKDQGIYVHFSTYFPLWLKPKPNNPWLAGYDGQHNAFAALYFNPDFQKQYQTWWRALLTTPNPKTGKRLIDEPAVSSLELVNEDSYFFWTFNPKAIPPDQLQLIESQFGKWAAQKYGSIDAAIQKWNGLKTDHDDPATGRLGFRPLWNIANQRTPRDQDTVAFLAEAQRAFYDNTRAFLRQQGFKGVITASNWTTASAQYLGPVERYTYAGCDFIDRHGYFGGKLEGQDSAWSIRDGDIYSDCDALKFESAEPGKPKSFNNPAMDIHYDGKPSMISETAFNRPNRFRTEAPLYYAAYGALQDTGAIVHFAMDTANWSVKPGFFMQPWTLMTPTQVGQFPAAALIFRKGLIRTGPMLVDLNLKIADILALRGTPMPQDASFDELRAKDVPLGTTIEPSNVIDPLVHYVGQTNTTFSETGGPAKLADLSRYIDRRAQTVSSATGELKLDYGKGILSLNAAKAQGVVGALKDAGNITLKDCTLSSDMDLGSIIAVSMDDKPLASSSKILLQVMSEERVSDFKTEPAGNGLQRITNIGHDPWQIRQITGTVKLIRPDASHLKVTALDANGEPIKEIGNAANVTLNPRAIYYLIGG
jgi:hypothetical protein